MGTGERLRLLREAAGLTLEEAGKIAGTSKQSVSQIEKGVTKIPGGLFLYRWSKHYNVNLEWLITGKGDRHPAPSQPARLDGTKLAESIAALRQVAKRRGWEYDPETHPLETEYAYALRCALPDTPSTADVIDFGERLAERLRQRAEGSDGQSDGGSAGGVDRRRAQGKRGAASEA